MAKPIVAFMYDFDKTLSPKNMQEYSFVSDIGFDSETFWEMCSKLENEHKMDQILAYMYLMIDESKGKKLLNREVFKSLGEKVELFKGVESWFDRINSYATEKGLSAEHYIISSGLKEIIEGTKISKHFKEIYAAEFCYTQRGEPFWPAMAVNYTSKTQFLYRINKGVLSVTEHDGLNKYTPEKDRRVPFKNMIYIGDGLTDVPCMKLCKSNGGKSIAVYNGNSAIANDMLAQDRVDFVVGADYSQGSRLEHIAFKIIDEVKAYNTLVRIEKSDNDADLY